MLFYRRIPLRYDGADFILPWRQGISGNRGQIRNPSLRVGGWQINLGLRNRQPILEELEDQLGLFGRLLSG